jgi:ADP-heptose:LPS heptosyltransferase
LDLQNNRLSNFVREALQPAAWAEFDRFSPVAAGERNRRTIEALGLGRNESMTGFELKSPAGVDELLRTHGWKPDAEIILLNPAGAFENRNWPLDHYIAFAGLWSRQYASAQFLVMGTGRIAEKARALKDALGARLIDLVNETTAATAFEILQRVRFALSEDSGMMHMAWVAGIPTLALFGSTRSDWARPLGPHTAFLDSSDLVCGNCMRETCLYKGADENMCMTRYTPEAVFELAMSLYETAARSGSST